MALTLRAVCHANGAYVRVCVMHCLVVVFLWVFRFCFCLRVPDCIPAIVFQFISTTIMLGVSLMYASQAVKDTLAAVIT